MADRTAALRRTRDDERSARGQGRDLEGAAEQHVQDVVGLVQAGDGDGDKGRDIVDVRHVKEHHLGAGNGEEPAEARVVDVDFLPDLARRKVQRQLAGSGDGLRCDLGGGSSGP